MIALPCWPSAATSRTRSALASAPDRVDRASPSEHGEREDARGVRAIRRAFRPIDPRRLKLLLPTGSGPDHGRRWAEERTSPSRCNGAGPPRERGGVDDRAPHRTERGTFIACAFDGTGYGIDGRRGRRGARSLGTTASSAPRTCARSPSRAATQACTHRRGSGSPISGPWAAWSTDLVPALALPSEAPAGRARSGSWLAAWPAAQTSQPVARFVRCRELPPRDPAGLAVRGAGRDGARGRRHRCRRRRAFPHLPATDDGATSIRRPSSGPRCGAADRERTSRRCRGRSISARWTRSGRRHPVDDADRHRHRRARPRRVRERPVDPRHPPNGRGTRPAGARPTSVSPVPRWSRTGQAAVAAAKVDGMQRTHGVDAGTRSGRDLADDLSITARGTSPPYIANGATLWSWLPTAPAHAADPPAEFLHPATMGKRAVPAVARWRADHVRASLRSAARPGDAPPPPRVVALTPRPRSRSPCGTRGCSTVLVRHRRRPGAGRRILTTCSGSARAPTPPGSRRHRRSRGRRPPPLGAHPRGVRHAGLLRPPPMPTPTRRCA